MLLQKLRKLTKFILLESLFAGLFMVPATLCNPSASRALLLALAASASPSSVVLLGCATQLTGLFRAILRSTDPSMRWTNPWRYLAIGIPEYIMEVMTILMLVSRAAMSEGGKRGAPARALHCPFFLVPLTHSLRYAWFVWSRWRPLCAPPASRETSLP